MNLSDLITPLTTDQAREAILTQLEQLGIPARSWRKGIALSVILRVFAILYAALSVIIAGFAASGFLDYASGGWLTLLARYVYGVTRPSATYAVGKVLFTNNGGGVHTDAAGTVVLEWIAGKKTYVTTEDLNLTSIGQTQLVSVIAVEIGAASSAGPGQITLQTDLLQVTATNPESVVGSDELADDPTRQLCRDKTAALSLLGPRGAYAYAVQVATRTDGSRVDVNRWVVVPNTDTGVVTVYVASPSGTPLPTDLDFIRDSVELWARPDSVTAIVVGVSTAAFAKTMTVWATATTGVAASDIQALVLSALTNMVSVYRIGGVKKPPATQGYLYASNIEGTAKSAHPSIFAIDGVGSDLPLSTGEVATLAATVNVRIVSSN